MRSPQSRTPLWLITIVVALVWSFPAAGGLPPRSCANPVITAAQLTVSYHGSTSGCTNQPGGNPNCIAGEPIVFTVTTTFDTLQCILTYSWNLGDGSPLANGLTTFAHTYAGVGTYTVRMTAIAEGNNVTIPVVVPILSNVPTLGPLGMIVLIVAIATLAVVRLR